MIINIAKAVEMLASGQNVVLPTETVYGLGAAINQENALQNIFKIKQRPSNNPLIVHVHPDYDINKIARKLPSYFTKLVDSFCPGPLTMVIKKKNYVSPIITSNQDTVAFRIPKHKTFLNVLEMLNVPIAAPSANRYQYLSPTHHQHVLTHFQHQLPVLPGGQTEIGIESTIIDITQEHEIKILRQGSISATQILSATSIPCVVQRAALMQIPGSAKKHYSPKTPLYIVESSSLDKICAKYISKQFVLLSYSYQKKSGVNMVSMPQDPIKYGKSLYNTLFKLDNNNHKLIILELPPNQPSWQWIRDKLFRAGLFKG